MQTNGFKVIKKDVVGSELLEIKAKYQVPNKLFSCHTAVVDGYVIEGHVPADVIKRLLRERPTIAGLGVPGMPIGSPGMEGPNPVTYRVLSFDSAGNIETFSTHVP